MGGGGGGGGIAYKMEKPNIMLVDVATWFTQCMVVECVSIFIYDVSQTSLVVQTR